MVSVTVTYKDNNPFIRVKCRKLTFIIIKNKNTVIQFHNKTTVMNISREVIENTAKQILDFNGSGLSLMEISHRAKDFQPVVDECVHQIKEGFTI